MVTVKTLNNSKSGIQSFIEFVEKVGQGSITVNNTIDLSYLKIKAGNTIFYLYKKNEVVITFKDDPYIEILGFKRYIQSVSIKDSEILFIVKGFPDLRIEVK